MSARTTSLLLLLLQERGARGDVKRQLESRGKNHKWKPKKRYYVFDSYTTGHFDSSRDTYSNSESDEEYKLMRFRHETEFCFPNHVFYLSCVDFTTWSWALNNVSVVVRRGMLVVTCTQPGNVLRMFACWRVGNTVEVLVKMETMLLEIDPKRPHLHVRRAHSMGVNILLFWRGKVPQYQPICLLCTGYICCRGMFYSETIGPSQLGQEYLLGVGHELTSRGEPSLIT